MKLTRPMFVVAWMAAAVLCAAVAMVPVPGLKPQPGFRAKIGRAEMRGNTVYLDYAEVSVGEWTSLRAREWMEAAKGEGGNWMERSSLIQVSASYANAVCMVAAGLVFFALPWQLRRQRQRELRSLHRIAELLRTHGATADPF